MNFVSNWKSIAVRAHSMWANYLGLFALFMCDIIFVTTGRDTDPAMWIWISAIFIIYAILGRLISQGIDGWARSKVNMWLRIILVGALVLAVAACDPQKSADQAPTYDPQIIADAPAQPGADLFMPLALSHIGKWEGRRLVAYRDIGGVWTICDGETRGVKEGDVKTDAECDAMFAPRIADFRDRLRPSFTVETVARRLPVERDVAFTSLAYNAGVGAISKSTAVRRLNAGDIVGGCEAIGWWKKAGGRVIRGLVRRRSEEVDLCLKGAV